MSLSANAMTVLERRYLRPGETPDEMFWRVARHVAKAEKEIERETWASVFCGMMARGDFLPNSPTLSGAGTPISQLSACFVLPVDDDLSSIYETVRQTAVIHKSGGGTGFSFNRLRPRGSAVATTNGVAGGPVSFMKVFDAATASIAQGSVRHGANMGILNADHPDILEFIHMKDDLSTLQNFNISVAVTEDWMREAIAPVPGPIEDPMHPHNVFHDIVKSAWKTGDPGLIFIDRLNTGRSNPCPSFGPIEATNPCGEQPLYPNDSCNLGSINLSNFLLSGLGHEHIGIDWDRLEKTVRNAVRFLDDVVTVNQYPIQPIADVSHAIRRIGLGVMGWADLLMKQHIRYDSEDAISLAKTIMSFIQDCADQASEDLAKERGTFPAWAMSIYGLESSNRPMRNSTRTTIAPTGTISIIAGCSSGIEPVFALSMKRQHNLDKNDPDAKTVMYEINPVFEQWLDTMGDAKPAILQRLESEGNHPAIPAYFRTAQNIPYEWHIRHQAAFQKYVDNAVSKTINMANSATVQDVAAAYIMAWETGCKGITIYRDGCRDQQVLSVSDQRHIQTEDAVPSQEEADEAMQTPIQDVTLSASDDPSVKILVPFSQMRRRVPKTAQAERHKFEIDGHEGYFIIGLFEDGTPGEIFLKLDKEGSMASGFADSFAIGFSMALQAGIPLDVLTRKYKGMRFDPAGRTGDPAVPFCTSIPDYVVKWLEQRYLGAPPLPDPSPLADTVFHPVPDYNGNGCPDCGGRLIHQEGCEVCSNCPFTRCG